MNAQQPMTQANDVVYWAQLYMSFVVILVIVFLIVWLLKKVKPKDIATEIRQSKRRLENLESDRRWRVVKVIYIALSTSITVITATSVYMSPARDEEAMWGYAGHAQLDMSTGVITLVVGALISWVIYRFLIPKLYTYLAPVRNSKK